MSNLWGIIISYIYILIVILAAKMFEKKGKEQSRKFIHIMLGNWWIIAMLFFNNVIWAAFVPATFVIINYLSYKKNIISVMERENEEEGLGTVYYAISLLILSIITFGIIHKPEIGLVPVLVMAYADGFAAIFGKKIKSNPIKIGKTTKSIAGCLTMFIVSFIITAVFLQQIGANMWPILALIMSLFATLVELISIKGLDNLTVPAVMFIMLMMI